MNQSRRDAQFLRILPGASRAGTPPQGPDRSVTIFGESTITCPSCGAKSREVMPTRAALCFYDCIACGATARSAPEDCCVFCLHGDVGCPSAQVARHNRDSPR